MDDKCYICHENEGILKKTCINDKCTARIHSDCLQEQYKTLKKCGVCKSKIIINKKFNYIKVVNFLLEVIIFILHNYLIFTLIMGLNPLDPLDQKFNDITVINNKDIYTTNYIIIAFSIIINFVCYMNPGRNENDSLAQLYDKHGKITIILGGIIIECIICILFHTIGYNFNVINNLIINENIKFYTYQSFLIGLAYTLYVFLMTLFTIACYKITICCLPCILDPFYDEEFGS